MLVEGAAKRKGGGGWGGDGGGSKVTTAHHWSLGRDWRVIAIEKAAVHDLSEKDEFAWVVFNRTLQLSLRQHWGNILRELKGAHKQK